MVNTKLAFLVLVVLGLVLTSFIANTSKAQNDTTNTQENKRTIDVSADYKATAEADRVDVYLGVQTERSTALASQQDNANIMQKIRSALAGIGVTSDSIQTTSYSIWPTYDYTMTPYRIKGYQTSNMIKVRLTDINKAGQVIDAAAGAGANQVNGVYFTISDSKRDQLEQQALTQASRIAKDKANAIASGLGVTIKQVVKASESSSYVPYYRSYNTMASGGAAPEAAPTEITPGDIEVSATVSVTFEIA